jgi:hypothetical protein
MTFLHEGHISEAHYMQENNVPTATSYRYNNQRVTTPRKNPHSLRRSIPEE